MFEWDYSQYLQGSDVWRIFDQGQAAFDMSIYDKSHLVSTVLQDTDGQFIGLSVAEGFGFCSGK